MNVLFVSGIAGGTRRYRCEHAIGQLAIFGAEGTLRATEVPGDRNALYADIVGADVVILHRVPHDETIADLIALAHLQGKPVVFETDDLVFEPRLLDQIGLMDSLTPEQSQRFRLDIHLQAQTLREADCVLTTTEALAGEAAAQGKPVYIHRNAASQEIVRRSAAAYARRQERMAQDTPVTLGYFSGSGSHDRDFAVVTPALLALLESHPHLHLHIAGPLTLDGRYHRFQQRIHRTPYLSWQELPQLIADIDINLAPLELANPFCQAKSEIKWMEAALVGVPTIATATDAFQHAIRHGEDGLLATTSAEWHELLSRLIVNKPWRQQIGSAAYGKAYANYAPEVAGQGLISTLQTIIASHSRPAAEGQIVAGEIARRMQRHLVRMQSTIDELDHRLEALRNAHTRLQSDVRSLRLEERERAQRQLERIEQRHVETLRAFLARLQQEESLPTRPTRSQGAANGVSYESA